MRRTFLNHHGIPTRNLFRVALILGALLLWLPCLGAAEPITPSGLHTQVSDPIIIGPNTQYDITGGTRPGGASGTNLFHSFGDFNVPTNSIANFLNSGSVDLAGHLLAAGLSTSNILAQVTDGNISNILGTIQTTNFPGANLFLMNPAGFLFGPNATVNVGGMMSFTTADYLRLSNGINNGYFSSDPSVPSLLTTAPVVAFGFLGSHAASIIVAGSTLRAAESQTLSLIGGNHPFEMTTETASGDFVPSGVTSPTGVVVTGGTLLAPSGSIYLASVASPGEILAGTLEHASNINGHSFGALGAIQISETSVVDVSGDGGGTVLIRGGHFVLDDSMILANVTGPSVGLPGAGIAIQVSQDAVIQNGAILDSSIFGNATPGVQYGGVTVMADRIEILGPQDSENAPETAIFSDVSQGSTGGSSGNIRLEANAILMRDFGTETTILNASTEGSGNSGSINLVSSGNLELDLAGIFTDSSGALGSAGNITLSSTQGTILLNETIVISQASRGSGKAGFMSLSAPHGDILLDASQVGNRSTLAGGLGTIDIGSTKVSLQVTADNLQLNDSSISGDNFDPTPAGTIALTLDGSMSLSNTSFIQTVSRGLAAAADLNIRAHDITIAEGSFLSTETRSSGHGGQLNIFTENLQIANGGQIRSGSLPGRNPLTGALIIPSGSGGTINIHGLESPASSVLIDGAGSGIFTNTEGTGAGGNIIVNANSVTLQNGGTLSAATSGTSSAATGGTVMVEANQVQLNNDGLITASTTGAGAGGSVNIGTATFTSNASTVSSTATQAQGGDITITAGQSATLNNGSSVSASSTGAGNAGNIVIDAGQTFLATNSSVTTEANQASGGAIKITTTSSGTVQLTNSRISASVLDGTGGGGSVNIDPLYVLLQNSQILAQAVRGPGGNITIYITNGGLFLPDANSTISASSQFGVNGTVTIQSPNAPGSGQVQPLGKSPLLATSLLSQRCAALAGGEFSSFTVAGKDSLPTEPGSWLTSPLYAAGVGLGIKAEGVTAEGERLETPLLSLRQIAPAGFLTQAFAVEGSSSCKS